jgi:hypothetical protein
VRAVVAALFNLPILFGCSRDVVVSTSYPRSDGSVAFIVDMNESDGGFDLRAIRPEGPESEALTRIEVSQCENGQLFWDGKNSVVFAHDYAAIQYHLSGDELGVDLSIEVCTKGSVACTAVVTSDRYKPPIPITC